MTTDRLREAAQELLDAEAMPAYSWVIESMEARAEGRPNREVERMDRIARARRDLVEALAATPDRDGLREAARWLVDIHADDPTIAGTALWEDIQRLRAALEDHR